MNKETKYILEDKQCTSGGQNHEVNAAHDFAEQCKSPKTNN